MINLTKIKKFLDRKIRRSEAEIEKYKEYNSKDHTFHGGWSKGYAEEKGNFIGDDVYERNNNDDTFKKLLAAAKFK